MLMVVATLLSACTTHRSASTRSPNDFGVLVMAHGGSRQWNDRVLAAVEPLAARYPVTVAFGMADAASLQDGVDELEQRGVRRIGVVRLFVSGESWYERTQQILGLIPGAPDRSPAAPGVEREHMRHHHAGHSMEFWRISTRAKFVMSQEGLADAPEIERILIDRARRLSQQPRAEDILILAHGPGDDAENERWIAKISARAAALKETQSFRRVEVQTLREDWPEKRRVAEQTVRQFIQRATHEGGRAIVIPFRVEGFGPYAEVLQGLDYASDAAGLLPHPNVTAWIERQSEQLRSQFRD